MSKLPASLIIGIGLYWFEEFLKRLQRVFGSQIEWVTTAELARIYCP